MSLSGRIALVTGASVGLGAAIAEAYAAAGASLMLCARSEQALADQVSALQAQFPAVVVKGHVADVGKVEQVDALFAAALNAFGHLDILVNNAGIYGPFGDIDAVDWDKWVDCININLMGTVYCSRKAVEHFRPRGQGKIINISGGGATNPLPGISGYAASKAAVVRFTETLALEMKPHGVDVNSVAPGALATRLTDELLDSGAGAVTDALYQRMKQIKEEGGTPLSVGAGLCVYLASDESRGVTGRLLSAPWDPWPFADEVKRDIDQSDIYTLRRIVPGDRGKGWDKS